MVGRRNIRSKVMQSLFMANATEKATPELERLAQLQKSFDTTRDLLVYLVHLVLETAKYAERAALAQANKHVKDPDEPLVNTKISGNLILWEIASGKPYKDGLEKLKFDRGNDQDIVKRIYSFLIDTSDYQFYINETKRDRKQDADILKFIFNNLILPDEIVASYIEDHFPNLDDDMEAMEQMVNEMLSNPSDVSLSKVINDEKWLFAKMLLTTCLSKKDHLMALIKDKLMNWDIERVAAIDLVLLQMGVAEFLYFETIPVRATINEYIELAKVYSTENSSQFINGILDNLQLGFEKEGLMNKVPYNAVEVN